MFLFKPGETSIEKKVTQPEQVILMSWNVSDHQLNTLNSRKKLVREIDCPLYHFYLV